MRIKSTYLILIVIAILIIIFAVSQKPKSSSQDIEKIKVEETLNKEINFTTEITEKTSNKEDSCEERVKKMYELLPPGEIIIE
ncbi:MAG: hypothetical protein ACPLKX_05690 [Dictyoglomaceae bacterium]